MSLNLSLDAQQMPVAKASTHPLLRMAQLQCVLQHAITPLRLPHSEQTPNQHPITLALHYLTAQPQI